MNHGGGSELKESDVSSIFIKKLPGLGGNLELKPELNDELVLKGHTARVNSVNFSPDGKFLASGSDDKSVCLWDVINEELKGTLVEHHANVNSVSYSLCGNFLASGSDDRSICLWDVRSNSLLRALNGHSNAVNSVSYSPDGNFVISGSDDKTVCLWEVKTGVLLKVLREHTAAVEAVTYSPNGRYVASVSNSLVVVWDADDFGEKMIFQRPIYLNSQRIEFSSDSRFLYYGRDSDRTVFSIDFCSPLFRLLYEFNPRDVLESLKFLWELEFDDEVLEYVHKPHSPRLYPNMGYYISFDKETLKYRELLDMSCPGETKIQQVVRFLEDRCAYKYPELHSECKPRPLKYDHAVSEKNSG